jgi:hypothetical protein
MRRDGRFWMAAALLVLAGPGLASACHTCKRNPCVVPAPVPAYQCVTEMVPYTVMERRTRVEYQPVTKTVMERIPETTFVERTRVVRKPVFDTQYVTRTRTVRRPVYDTQYVMQNYTVCKPVTTTRTVMDCVMQPVTSYKTVPVMAKAGGHGCGLGLLCGGHGCKGLTQVGCQTVAQTCYQPTQVAREVVSTTMVPETHTRQVPVTSCRIVCEQKVEQVPVTSCRIVCETVVERVPVTRFRCEPKTITVMKPVCVPECVPVTKYRAVQRMVPCAPAAPVAYAAPAPQAAPQATGQGA